MNLLNNFMITFLLVLISSTQALAITSSRCQFQASSYGDGSGKDYINPSCLDVFLNAASENSIKESPSGEKKIIAYKNIVFIKNLVDPNKRTLIYAGNNTTLTDIAAVSWDENNNEFCVLDSVSGRVLYFSSIIDGNVSPLRELNSDLLLGANDLIINHKKDETIVLNNSQERILVFSRLSNIHGRKDRKKQEAISRVDALGNGSKSLGIDHKNGQLIIIKESNSIQEEVIYKLDDINQTSRPL